MTVAEVMDVVARDLPFYLRSGGGVTLSGGEPLSQPSFALALLKACAKVGIHTALDTTGLAKRRVLEEVLPYLNLVLFDIKHTDPDAHSRATGASNRLILDNLRFLSGNVDLWLRVPVIPGFNDDPGTIAAILSLVGEISYSRLFFLAYHQWGTGKYEWLGRHCNTPPAGAISEETLRTIQRLAESSGVHDVAVVP